MGHPPSAWLWEGVSGSPNALGCVAVGCVLAKPWAFRRGTADDLLPATQSSTKRRVRSAGARTFARGVTQENGYVLGHEGVAIEVQAVTDAGSFRGRLRRDVLRCGIGGMGIVCNS